ncbi:MAG: glycosyltransferase, partial [Pseudomonadota bacterium]
SQSKVAINAAVDNSPYFYSSDRVAQYFSAGCLVAQPRGAQLEQLYGPDTMLLFSDAQELADQAEELLKSGRWKDIARHGQKRALELSSSEVIARYMIDRCFDDRTFEWPAWTSEFYEKE